MLPKRMTDCGTSRSTTTREPRFCSMVGRDGLERRGLRHAAEHLVEQRGQAVGVDGADYRDLHALLGDEKPVMRDEIVARDRRHALDRAGGRARHRDDRRKPSAKKRRVAITPGSFCW